MYYEEAAETLILQAANKARSMGHSYVGSAHILLALTEATGMAGLLLRGAGMETELVRSAASVLYGTGTPDLPLPQGLTLEAESILYMAGQEARQLGSRRVCALHILLALLRQQNCAAWELMLLGCVDMDTLLRRPLIIFAVRRSSR